MSNPFWDIEDQLDPEEGDEIKMQILDLVNIPTDDPQTRVNNEYIKKAIMEIAAMRLHG